MTSTMPQDDFYAKVRRGMPRLVAQWRDLGRDSPERLALLLAETARVARIGLPEATPDAATLAAWSEAEAGDEQQHHHHQRLASMLGWIWPRQSNGRKQ